MDDFAYCGKCYDNLAEHSKAMADLWLQLCREYALYGEIYAYPSILDDSASLRHFEQSGYIVTHELDDEILVRPLGMFFASDDEDEVSEPEVYFCANFEEHCLMAMEDIE